MAKRRLQDRSTKQGANHGIASHSSPDMEPPIFSLRYMVQGYSVADCDKDQKAAFADALWKRSQLTWAQIKGAPRQGLGTEKISRQAIKNPIPSHVMPDVTYFLALRFYHKAPMVGYRTGNIFYILWLDCKFTLYDH